MLLQLGCGDDVRVLEPWTLDLWKNAVSWLSQFCEHLLGPISLLRSQMNYPHFLLGRCLEASDHMQP
jgi:hypothetical protein